MPQPATGTMSRAIPWASTQTSCRSAPKRVTLAHICRWLMHLRLRRCNPILKHQRTSKLSLTVEPMNWPPSSRWCWRGRWRPTPVAHWSFQAAVPGSTSIRSTSWRCKICPSSSATSSHTRIPSPTWTSATLSSRCTEKSPWHIWRPQSVASGFRATSAPLYDCMPSSSSGVSSTFMLILTWGHQEFNSAVTKLYQRSSLK